MHRLGRTTISNTLAKGATEKRNVKALLI